MVNERKRRMRFGTSPVTLALLAGWVVVVVVGAGRRPDDAPLLGVENLGAVLFGVLVLAALLGLALIIYLKPDKPEGAIDAEKRRQPWLLYAALVVLFMLWRPNIIEAINDLAEQATEQAGEPEEAVIRAPEPPAESVAQATDIALLVLAIAVVGGVWFLARRRTIEPLETAVETKVDERLEAEMLVAMQGASMELSLTGDPRSAVLNAYASLERVLATRERRRLPAETPTEHLKRSVKTLRVDPAPIVQLGALYELARFSEQEITAGQQNEARLALDRARQDLAALA